MTHPATVVDCLQNPNGYQVPDGGRPSGGRAGSDDLGEAARCYATAVLAAKEASDAAQKAEAALHRADIDAIIAANADWEAEITSERTTANETGFTAEFTRSEVVDRAETGRAAQIAKLRYHQCRVVAMRTDLNAGEATRAAETAENRLLETARRLATQAGPSHELTSTNGGVN